MARPRIFDYAVESDEEIVTEGVQGAEPTWIGMDINNQKISIVCSEGVLNATGDGIETVTRRGQQEDFNDSEVAALYSANKAAFDAIIAMALEAWAARRNKTGAVISS